MTRYAVAMCNGGFDADDFWIEFYDADDAGHAEEQAENAHPGSAVICVAHDAA